MTVSAVIKAKNEANEIVACIKSAQLVADEVLVVNDHSTDDTADLARSCGAIVILGDDHGGEINRLDAQGFEAATGDWLLRMDADERVTPGLASRLKEISENPSVAGVRFARKNYFFDGWMLHGGWFRPEQLGFFRAAAWDRSWNYDIHSQVPVAGMVVTIRASEEFCMLHYDYLRVEEFVSRSLLSYARLEGVERAKTRGRQQTRNLLLGPMRRGLGRYFLRGGYRDGQRGAVVAALLAAYEVSVEAFAWQAIKDAQTQRKNAE